METHIIQTPHHGTILCPVCGVKFKPTHGNLCQTCIVSNTDITKQIPRDYILHFCRFCARYNRPPWINCERESRELLAICLSKIKNISKLKLVDASFVWTQPHSRRIKVKLVLSKELDNNAVAVEQSVIVQFTEVYQQCPDCKKEFTPHTWGAQVQVRQHAEHKKTLYYLEQLIIKHNLHEYLLKVEEVENGVDFFFKTQSNAQRMVDFLTSNFPTSVKTSKQLISHDESSNKYNYKYSFSVEIPKLSKQDLLIIPKKVSNILGGCGSILLCWKITSVIHLLDLSNYKTLQMSSNIYFQYQHKMDHLHFSKFKSEFVVLDAEVVHGRNNHNNTTVQNPVNTTALTMLNHKIYKLVITKKDEFEQIEVRCHLGDLMPGQVVEGIDFRHLNYYEWMNLNQFKGVDDVVICRKVKQNKGRAFKLKRLEAEIDEKKRKKKVQKEAKDYEEFLDDIENDKELRKAVKIYANKDVLHGLDEQMQKEVLGNIDKNQLLEEQASPDWESEGEELLEQMLSKKQEPKETK